MKRVIALQADHERSAKRFEILYAAILAAGAMPANGHQRSFEEVRRDARLLEALDGISEEDRSGKPGPDGEPMRKLTGGELLLTVPEHEHLARAIERVPWHPRAARDAVDAADFLTSAEKVED